jgi:hypothetical protein
VSAHKLLADAIKDVVPADWRVIDHERNLDEPDAITVQIKLDEVRRLPQAPQSGIYSVMWTVTVLTPWADPARADPDVFDALLELVAGLERYPWMRWARARKVLEAQRYAFDIELETMTTDNPAAYAAGDPESE